MITDEQIKTLLTNVKPTSKNHYLTDCPFCFKQSHFYIKRKTKEVNRKNGKNKSGSWDCKKCGESGTVFSLLSKLGKMHFLRGTPVELDKKLEGINIDELLDVDLEVADRKMPLGFRRTDDDPYLTQRGFTPHDYDKYTVGRTKLSFVLENYVIIKIEQDKKCKGFLSRIVLPKKQVDKLEKKRGKKIPRYRNDKAEFTKLLMGVDEFNFMTDTAILVEGFFDKKRVDEVLELDKQYEIKCCCTFGKKISQEQILLLISKGIENIILIQDPDALEDSKKTGFDLQKYFHVLLGTTSGGKDLDDCTEYEVLTTFDNLKKPEVFSVSYVEIKKL